ncbi:MAG: DUF4278 domain-containing protein [Microcystaceae cyanobacterium]
MSISWLFLIPLITGVISGYISYYLMDEIAYFTGAFSLICLLIGLLIAPWELQLLILVVVLIAVRLFWLKLNPSEQESNELVEEGESTPSDHRTYRGIAYPSQGVETQNQMKRSKKGTYRGIPWSNNQKKTEVRSESYQSQFIRKYRGITLNNSEDSE